MRQDYSVVKIVGYNYDNIFSLNTLVRISIISLLKNPKIANYIIFLNIEFVIEHICMNSSLKLTSKTIIAKE